MNILGYSEFIEEAVDQIDHLVKRHSQGKIRATVESLGYEFRPYLRELTYLDVYGLFLAIRTRFEDDWEQMTRDVGEALFKTPERTLFEEVDILQARIQLNERLIEYMNLWNQHMEVQQHGEGISASPAFVLAQHACVHAYGTRGKSIRLVMLSEVLFMEHFQVFLEALKNTNVQMR